MIRIRFRESPIQRFSSLSVGIPAVYGSRLSADDYIDIHIRMRIVHMIDLLATWLASGGIEILSLPSPPLPQGPNKTGLALSRGAR